MHSLHLINLIDKGIKNQKRFLNSSSGRKWRKIAAKTSMLRVVLLVLYISLPFIEKPPWCLDKAKELSRPWSCNNEENIYYNSGLPKLPRYISIPLDTLVIAAMLGFKLMQRLYKTHNPATRKIERVQVFLLSVSLVDIFLDLVLPVYNFPYVASIIRPIYFVMS